MYFIKTATLCASSWSILLISGIAYFTTDNKTDFLHWGPSDVKFGGLIIDTWSKWLFVMCYSIFSQVIYSIVSSNLSPYISNVIRDYKTPKQDKGKYINCQIIVQIYSLYHWLSNIFDVFLWITLQLQYLVPAIITDLILTLYFTHNFYVKSPKNINTLSLIQTQMLE